MYALVLNEKVISGPRGWNSAFFRSSLSERGETVTGLIPTKAPDTMPYTITDNARVVLVNEVRPEINSFIEYHRGPLWSNIGDTATATYEVVEQPLEFAKRNYKQFLAEHRYRKETDGTTAIIQDQTVSIDTSREGRNIFVQKLMLMGESDTVNWKFPEGWLVLTKNQLAEVVQAGAAYIQAVFDWEQQIVSDIDSETELSELVKYRDIIDPPQDRRPNLDE